MTLSIVLPLVCFCCVSLPNARATPAVDAVNDLGLDLYRLETATSPRNIVLSPYSISTALAMTMEGAAANTREEMEKVLHLDKKSGVSIQALAKLRMTLEKAAGDNADATAKKYRGEKVDKLELRIASRLFGSESGDYRTDFLKTVEDRWKAPLEKLDFTNAGTARSRINSWVEEQTGTRIRNVVPENGVDERTRLLLVNALYFKAAWHYEFAAWDTTPQPFYVDGKTTANVPIMFMAKYFGYTKEKDFSVISVPYLERDFQFLILLPDQRDGLASLSKSLAAVQLRQYSNLPRNCQVKLHLPKFKIAPEASNLTAHLTALGMKSAFGAPANFSRMMQTSKDRESPVMAGVLHKAMVSLDEKGTEAAAAVSNEVMADFKEPPPVNVDVDHPFLFAIQHQGTGVCLFIGCVNDPR